MRRVAIVSHGQTHHGLILDRTLGEMVFDVTREALARVHLTRDDIDCVCGAGIDLIDGKSISNSPLVGPSGAYQKDESKVEEDGLMAAVNAFARIASGHFDIALVYAAGHGHTTDLDLWSRLMFEPALLRPLGLCERVGLALQAADYANRSGATAEDSALAVVRARAAAAGNEFAHERAPLTVQDVFSSEEFASPLHELDYAPVSDGAAALILAGEERAPELSDRPVWIAGIGNALEPYHLGRRRLSALEAGRAATRRALARAGLAAVDQVDLFEVSAPTGYHELMLYEAMGLCEEGQAPAKMAAGEIGPDGRIKVNPSGGMLATNPPVVVGLLRLLEVYLQLIGKAEGHQREGVRFALAHGASGACLQSHTVVTARAG